MARPVLFYPSLPFFAVQTTILGAKATVAFHMDVVQRELGYLAQIESFSLVRALGFLGVDAGIISGFDLVVYRCGAQITSSTIFSFLLIFRCSALACFLLTV